MWRSRWRCVIKPAYSVSFLLSINIFVWQNVLYFLDAPRILWTMFIKEPNLRPYTALGCHIWILWRIFLKLFSIFLRRSKRAPSEMICCSCSALLHSWRRVNILVRQNWGSLSGVDENSNPLWGYAVSLGKYVPTFRWVVSTPSTRSWRWRLHNPSKRPEPLLQWHRARKLEFSESVVTVKPPWIWQHIWTSVCLTSDFRRGVNEICALLEFYAAQISS